MAFAAATLAGGVTAVGAGAVGLYRKYAGSAEGDDDEDEDEVIVVDGKDDKGEYKTWKESSGREWGGSSYVFGDLTRGAIVKLRGQKSVEETIEAEGDAQHTQVQRLIKEAVKLYRARGLSGSVNFSHTIAHFTESASVRVDGPAAEKGAPLFNPKDKAAVKAAADAHRLVSEDGKAGVVFTTLLSRLERRAKSWQALAGDEDLDPSLSSSAHIGFAVPVIKVGWGVSVSLTVTTSSLLRWAEMEEAIEAAEKDEAEAEASAKSK